MPPFSRRRCLNAAALIVLAAATAGAKDPHSQTLRPPHAAAPRHDQSGVHTVTTANGVIGSVVNRPGRTHFVDSMLPSGPGAIITPHLPHSLSLPRPGYPESDLRRSHSQNTIFSSTDSHHGAASLEPVESPFARTFPMMPGIVMPSTAPAPVAPERDPLPAVVVPKQKHSHSLGPLHRTLPPGLQGPPHTQETGQVPKPTPVETATNTHATHKRLPRSEPQHIDKEPQQDVDTHPNSEQQKTASSTAMPIRTRRNTKPGNAADDDFDDDLTSPLWQRTTTVTAESGTNFNAASGGVTLTTDPASLIALVFSILIVIVIPVGLVCYFGLG